LELDEALRSTSSISSFSDKWSGPEKLYNFAKAAEGWVADPDEERPSFLILDSLFLQLYQSAITVRTEWNK
jgi:hypothetical protein